MISGHLQAPRWSNREGSRHAHRVSRAAPSTLHGVSTASPRQSFMVGIITIITSHFTNEEKSNEVNDRIEKGRELEARLLTSARPHSPRARSGLQVF